MSAMPESVDNIEKPNIDALKNASPERLAEGFKQRPGQSKSSTEMGSKKPLTEQRAEGLENVLDNVTGFFKMFMPNVSEAIEMAVKKTDEDIKQGAEA